MPTLVSKFILTIQTKTGRGETGQIKTGELLLA
jgi:hypothetical protein